MCPRCQHLIVQGTLHAIDCDYADDVMAQDMDAYEEDLRSDYGPDGPAGDFLADYWSPSEPDYDGPGWPGEEW